MIGIIELIEHNIVDENANREEEKELIKMLRKASIELDKIVKDIDGKLSS